LSFGFISACIADIAFVIDNSGSIRDSDAPGGNNWQLIIDFVKSIIDTFTIGSDYIRIAVVDFGWYCTTQDLTKLSILSIEFCLCVYNVLILFFYFFVYCFLFIVLHVCLLCFVYFSATSA